MGELRLVDESLCDVPQKMLMHKRSHDDNSSQ